MEENYSAADEYDNLEDIFEDIPEDQVEETEREIRNLRKWFDILRKNIVMMKVFRMTIKKMPGKKKVFRTMIWSYTLYLKKPVKVESFVERNQKATGMKSRWIFRRSHQVRKRNLFMKKRLQTVDKALLLQGFAIVGTAFLI